MSLRSKREGVSNEGNFYRIKMSHHSVTRDRAVTRATRTFLKITLGVKKIAAKIKIETRKNQKEGNFSLAKV